MNYLVEDGRVLTRSLEIHVTDHCNLRCKGCCTLSPFLPPRFVGPQRLRQDLELARRVLQPEILKLTGGEPLLHPQIVDCIRIAKASGFSVSLTTNGLLLPRMPESFWDELDRLTISLYPGIRIDLDSARAQCATHGTQLRIKKQDEFEELTSERPHSDEAARTVYQGCWMKRRCHLLRDGVFYICTRPPHFDTYFRAPGQFSHPDGIPLRGDPEMLQDLLWYLERNEPLASCRHCWGGQGKRFPHAQLAGR